MLVVTWLKEELVKNARNATATLKIFET